VEQSLLLDATLQQSWFVGENDSQCLYRPNIHCKTLELTRDKICICNITLLNQPVAQRTGIYFK